MIKPNIENNIKRINRHPNLFEGGIFFLSNSLAIFKKKKKSLLDRDIDRDKKCPLLKVCCKINIKE